MFTLPSDNFSKDKVTPYRCSLLVLIKEYALLYDGKNKNYPRMIWQDEWSSKRHLDRALLSWIQQPDGSLKDILRVVSSCSKVLYGEFTATLDSICNFGSIGNLEDFFINLGYAVFEEKESLLNKRGLLGLFSRRMLVYYERLSFNEIQPVFENFIKYCSPYIDLKQPLSQTISKSTHDMEDVNTIPTSRFDKITVDDMELESQSEMDSKSSRDSIDTDLKPTDLKCDKCDDFEVSECFAYQQAEFFFSQQAALLEVKESDALPPAALQNKIRQVLKSNPELTQAHYVSYLNNLRLREFCGAMDSLFMCFVRHSNKSSALTLKKVQERESNRTQRFATLNLALLHLRFGHRKAALAAAKEAIRLAQISNDTMCLQHGMSLLNHLQPKVSTKKVTNEIIKPGKMQKLTDLAFLAVQAHMHHLSQEGKKPGLLFCNLAAADALQCSRPYTHFASTTFAHKASLWKMYGKRHMSFLHCQLALSMQSSLDKKSYTSPTRYNSEDIALCLSHLVELLNEEGMWNEACDLLNHTKMRFPAGSRHSQFWRKAEARHNHQSCLRLCKHVEALHMQQALTALDITEAKLRESENLASRSEILKSHSVLKELLQENPSCDEELKPEVKCQIYILLGDLLSRNIGEHATSFRYLLQALTLAHRCYFHGLASEALLKIAQLQSLSGSPLISLSCLQSFVGECQANGGLLMRCRLLLVAVRCLIKQNKLSDLKDFDHYSSCLLESRVGFEKLQDLARQRDVVYLLAKLFNEKAKIIEKKKSTSSKPYFEAIHHRNEFAAEFKRLDIQIGSLSYVAVI